MGPNAVNCFQLRDMLLKHCGGGASALRVDVRGSSDGEEQGWILDIDATNHLTNDDSNVHGGVAYGGKSCVIVSNGQKNKD